MMTKNDIELIFKQHYMRMYRLAASILYDEDESKDVVSEVFTPVGQWCHLAPRNH